MIEKRIAILNVASGGWYPRGQVRLMKSFEKVMPGYGFDFLFWRDGYPEGSASHRDIPYQFKPYAFKYAIDSGFDYAIWMDSSVYLKKDISPIIDQIKSEGYFFFQNGWTSGEWLCDNQCEPLGITREESFSYPHIMACVMGFDLKNPKSLAFLKKWTELSIYFKGSWTSCIECSDDPRVKGSRHDQAFASVISHQMQMRHTPPKGLISYDVNDDAILIAQGM